MVIFSFVGCLNTAWAKSAEIRKQTSPKRMHGLFLGLFVLIINCDLIRKPGPGMLQALCEALR